MATSLAATVGLAGPVQAEPAIAAGDRVVAARFHDRCDGGSDVQLLNPYAAEVVFEVNGEAVTVGPQQRPWHSVAAALPDGVVDIQIFDPATTGHPDGLTHTWTPPSSCTGSGDAKVPGQSRLSVQDNGLPAGDSLVAARFRDGCAGVSEVQLPNPYSSDLTFEVNGDHVVVGPQQQPWHTTTAAGRRWNRPIEVLVERPGSEPDSLTHRWVQPGTCTGASPSAG